MRNVLYVFEEEEGLELGGLGKRVEYFWYIVFVNGGGMVLFFDFVFFVLYGFFLGRVLEYF